MSARSKSPGSAKDSWSMVGFFSVEREREKADIVVVVAAGAAESEGEEGKKEGFIRGLRERI